MWFDAQRALAEIQADTPATIATPATNPAPPPANVAIVADVAAPPEQKPQSATLERQQTRQPDGAAHGVSVAGNPITWTGRIVSLDAWRQLTQWERHGQDGKYWNGQTQRWEAPKLLDDFGKN